MGEKLSIDEVALSEGELYTVVTNTETHTQKGSLVAMVQGTRSQEVTTLLQQIPRGKREEVKEITLDLAKNMELIAENSFPQADLVSDRFHVQQLPKEALQEMRIKYRWQAIDLENQLALHAREQGERYKPKVFSNGDTLKQLLARSRYLLFKTEKQWTQKQTERAQILFDLFPDLKKAYQLTMMFRNIYQTAQSEQQAFKMLNKWYQKIDKYGYETFITAANSIKLHQKTILNYFKNRSTNALAENFNGKIKAFRSVFRGITDVSFFLYRVSLIFA